jgi:hypothetical protein
VLVSSIVLNPNLFTLRESRFKPIVCVIWRFFRHLILFYFQALGCDSFSLLQTAWRFKPIVPGFAGAAPLRNTFATSNFLSIGKLTL